MEFPPSRHPWSVRIKKPPLAGTGLSWRKQQNFVVLEGVGVCGLAPIPTRSVSRSNLLRRSLPSTSAFFISHGSWNPPALSAGQHTRRRPLGCVEKSFPSTSFFY